MKKGLLKNRRWVKQGKLVPLMLIFAVSFMCFIETTVLNYAYAKNKYQRSKLTRDETDIRADKRKIILATGEDKIVDLDFEPHENSSLAVHIGNPKMLVVQKIKIGEKGTQLVFKPLSAGRTNVTIRDPNGEVKVIFDVRITGSSLLKTKAELYFLLKDIEGLDIKIVGSRIIFDGEVLVPSDYGRIINVLTDETYKGYVTNLVILSPLSLQVLAKRIQKDITNIGTGVNVTTRVVNGKIFLEGTVDSFDQARRAELLATQYLPDLKPADPLVKDETVQRMAGRSMIINLIVVNPPPAKKQEKLVRVTVHFVELAKDYNKVFGFKWEPGFTADPSISIGKTADGTGGASGTSFTGTISSLIPKLQSAQVAGYARILKTGTFIVRSGQPGTLSQQTELPYLQQGPNGQMVPGMANVGLSVSVTPTILGSTEDVKLAMDMSQSNMVGKAPATGAPPVTAKNAIKTSLYVKSNQSAAVAGIFTSDVGTEFNKDDPRPGSFEGGTDPLFSLLRSKAFRKKKSQVVVFVTPQIVENASDATQDLKKNFRVKVQ